MDLERAFRLSSIILAASGFTSLILTGELPLGLILFGLAALTLSLLQLSKWGAGWGMLRWSRETWNVLLVLAFLGFVMDALWISQDLLPAGIHFLIALMVNKLFNLHERRDFLHLYAISLLQLLAAAALTIELWYAGVFITYLLAAIWTLLLFNLRNEETASPNVGGLIRNDAGVQVVVSGPVTSQFFWATNTIALGAFALTLVIFFAIPRIGAGFFQKNRMELIRTSGFSEKVDLSAIGAIKLDETVVMRVEFPDVPRPDGQLLYLRGGAYDFYDGRTWSNTLSQRRPVLRGPDDTFHAAERHRTPQPILRQDILLEPLDTVALFAVSSVEMLHSAFLVVQSDMMGNLYLPYPPSTRLQYSVHSVLHPIQDIEREAKQLVYPADIRRRFLQVPVLSTRVRDLAVQITQAMTAPFEKVRGIERHLRTGYRYSLDVTAGSKGSGQGSSIAGDPIEEFLFIRKTGYCEHYASAMVLMLRSIGIPARLATGFLPGEWNDYGNYYTVRQRDAHAWVEVFFPVSGWVTFDPTPDDGQLPASRMFLQMGRMMDSVRLKWDRFVIQYSFKDQMVVAQGIRERGEQLRSRSSEWIAVTRQHLHAGYRWVATLGHSPAWRVVMELIGGGVIAALSIWIWRKFSWMPWPDSRGSLNEQVTVRLYLRMLRMLRRRGLAKRPSATPLQFAGVVRREWSEADQFVRPLTELYCRVRFGRVPLTPEELQQADSLLRGLKAAPKQFAE